MRDHLVSTAVLVWTWAPSAEWPMQLGTTVSWGNYNKGTGSWGGGQGGAWGQGGCQLSVSHFASQGIARSEGKTVTHHLIEPAKERLTSMCAPRLCETHVPWSRAWGAVPTPEVLNGCRLQDQLMALPASQAGGAQEVPARFSVLLPSPTFSQSHL